MLLFVQCELFLLMFFCVSVFSEDSVIEVILKVPDDAYYRKSHSFFSIARMMTIQKVSSPISDKFKIDTTSRPNRIVIMNPDFLSGAIVKLNVDSDSENSHVLNLKVERISPIEVFDSVYITGPTSDMKKVLTSLKASIRTIMRDDGTRRMSAAVQVLKPGSLSAFLPLSEAQEWVRTEVKKLSPNVLVMPRECKRKTLCRSRLSFKGGLYNTKETVVDSESSDNFIGFDLVWETQTAEKILAERCTPGTCLNGGECDTNFKGRGYRCICPSLPNTPWGSRCEHPTRSYSHTTPESLVFTRHWIGEFPVSTDSLELSFEFAGKIHISGRMLTLMDSNNSPLIAVSGTVTSNNIIIESSLFTNAIDTGAAFSVDLWSTIHILFKLNQVIVATCQRNSKSECFVQTRSIKAESFAFTGEYSNSWLEIGKGFKGCVQSVLVNGYTVDLAIAREFGGAKKTAKFCHFQDSACGKIASATPSEYACGDQSVCYGSVNDEVALGTNIKCSCKCLGSKRKVVETIIDSEVCRLQDASKCSKESFELITRSSDEVFWSLDGVRSMPIPSKEVSMELDFLTEENNVHKVLRARMVSANGLQDMEMYFRISNGFLSLCLNFSVSDCREFPPKVINKGNWHSASAEIKRSLLVLTLDGVSSMHSLSRDLADFKTFSLSFAIPNSKLRRIRAFGVYMPTSKTDSSMDSSRGFLMVQTASDLIISAADRRQIGAETTPQPTTHSAKVTPKSKLMWIIIGICAAVVVGIIAAVLVFLIFCRKDNKAEDSKPNQKTNPPNPNRKVEKKGAS